MSERVEKKLAQIEKIERRVAKWKKQCSEKDIEVAYQFKDNYKGLVQYRRENRISYECDELRHALQDLDTAYGQLEKIKKQEEVKKAKEDSLNEMPEAMKKFAVEMIQIWNEYDKHERDFLRSEYDKYTASENPKESYQGYKQFIRDYKYSGYEKMQRTDEEIEKENKKAVDSLILNLLNRVIEKTGKITDAAGLRVTRGNGGYAVINGVVIGEKGTAVVESIGAGGYNIQRYHIRTLVK